jgi:hypothetical protein
MSFERGLPGSTSIASRGSWTSLDAAESRVFPPAVILYVVKLACELPEVSRRSITLWTCTELAKTLVRDKVVDSISGETVRRILFFAQAQALAGAPLA